MESSRSEASSTQVAWIGVARDRELVVAADHALRTTLGASIRAPQCDGEVAGPRLRAAVRALCEAAHLRAANAEDVIIAVKQAWASLTELTARPGEAQRGEMLRHFISACIDEFYADDAPSRASRGAAASS